MHYVPTKIISSGVHRGCSAFFGASVGLAAAGSTMIITYIVGAIAFLIASAIFWYNWKHPADDLIPPIPDSMRRSKVVWGFWHTGENIRRSFRYVSAAKVLVIDPNDTTVLENAAKEAGEPISTVRANICLTTNAALGAKYEVKWHSEQTASSFTIYDSSPLVEGKVVSFSKKAFIVVQLMDRNLVTSECKTYKITKAKQEHIFKDYVDWFTNVWDNHSKDASQCSEVLI